MIFVVDVAQLGLVSSSDMVSSTMYKQAIHFNPVWVNLSNDDFLEDSNGSNKVEIQGEKAAHRK